LLDDLQESISCETLNLPDIENGALYGLTYEKGSIDYESGIADYELEFFIIEEGEM